MKNKVETRGRKPLFDEESKTVGVIMSFTMIEILDDLAFETKKTVSHHVRFAVAEMFKKKRRQKKRA